jgi:RND family efflux transporter MFP subunit
VGQWSLISLFLIKSSNQICYTFFKLTQEVLRTQKSVDALQVKLAHYRLYSPVDGYVIAKDATIGASVLPTQPILKIVNPKDVWVRAYVDERISGDIHRGQKATIHLRSHPKKDFSAYVKRIAAQSDAVTQEREVDVAFENLPIPFYINEQAEVSIEAKVLQNAIKVPLNAVVHKDGIAGVWVVKNKKALFQKISVLGMDEKMAAVKGVDADTVIVIPSKEKKPLHQGAKVF